MQNKQFFNKSLENLKEELTRSLAWVRFSGIAAAAYFLLRLLLTMDLTQSVFSGPLTAAAVWLEQFFLMWILKYLIPIALLAVLIASGLWSTALYLEIRRLRGISGQPVALRAEATGAAEGRLEQLQRMCTEDPFERSGVCVRVQILSDGAGVPRDRRDYLVEWNEKGEHTIPVYDRISIRLKLFHGRPCILGWSAEENRERAYPLQQYEPLLIVRGEGTAAVRRFAITWLGGST